MFSSLRSRKLLLVALAFALWSVFLYRAINTFKPGIYSATFFNSDCAIPVLMSNHKGPITLYHRYYFGVDRIGGWPYLFAQIFGSATGFHWSPQRLSIIQTTWIFIGALVAGALTRKDGAVAAMAVLLVLCLHGETRYQIFTLAVNYSWQISTVLFSWYGLRQIIEKASPNHAQSSQRTVWMLATFASSFLAVWSSIESVPFLLFLLALEVLRSAMRRPDRTLKVHMKAAAIAFVPLLLATLAEQLQRWEYYRQSLKDYGVDLKTRFEFDMAKNLAANLQAQIANLVRLEWWAFDLLATATIICGIGVVAYAIASQKAQLRKRISTALANDTVILIVGAYGIAAINFLLTWVVTHVRANSYEDRYLIPTTLFTPVSAILILFLLFRKSLDVLRAGHFAKPIFLILSVVLLWVAFPARTYRREYDSFQTMAKVLAQKAPNGVLLGDYWVTYVVAALQPANAVTPVPIHEFQNRMPWTRDVIRSANEILVEYRGSGLEINGAPPEHLSAYGTSFHLTQPKVYEDRDFVVGWYAKDQ